MDEIQKKVIDAVISDSITFDIDITYSNWFQKWLQKVGVLKKKKEFEIKPLTLAQLERISRHLLDIDVQLTSTDSILKLISNHSRTCAEIVAVAVTASRNKAPRALVEIFYNNLAKNDLHLALQIVLNQMDVQSFILSIASIRSLSMTPTQKSVSAKSAGLKEANPMEPVSSIAPSIAPGTLSAVS